MKCKLVLSGDMLQYLERAGFRTSKDPPFLFQHQVLVLAYNAWVAREDVVDPGGAGLGRGQKGPFQHGCHAFQHAADSTMAAGFLLPLRL